MVKRPSIVAVVKDTANNAGDLGFDPRSDQIGLSVANGSPPQQHSSELCCPGAKAAEMVPLLVARLGVIPQVGL